MDPPQSSSSAASSMSRRNYQAFLSFRGPDTRRIFISHLYRALSEKGIYTFQDSEELERGQKRSELFNAIEGSRVAVVTFSKNYAGSKWCLDELQMIMECMGQGKLSVIPIFYHVSPREVRLHEKDNGEKGCYQIAMEEMEAKYGGRDSETVKRWRKVLWDGGDLIGIEVISGQDEGDVVQDVVETVMKVLNPVPLEVAKHPVGIADHLMALRSFLHIDSHVDYVHMVGLLGPGGAGKTTLSKAICNDIAYRFDSWCFLPNVRETTSRVFNGLAQLQQELLQELLNDKDLKVSSVDIGKTLIEKRLGEKRVLVILDDVEELIQLDALAGDLNWFGKGSRIILTTRNEHVLTANKVPKYEVNLLKEEEAGDLFRRHAFGEDEINIDCSLVDRFVEYAGKLPLALVVLGAFLRGRSQSEWEGKLKELNESPDKAINNVLKISYNGLDEKHKDIFLDVACLFKGWDINYVEMILDGCGFAASLGLPILRERCLITIVNKQIQMHDLLVEMGQNIVRDKGNGIPNKIWLYEDFWKILSDERSAQKRQLVEGIMLDLSKTYDRLMKFNALKDFKKLRILIIVGNAVCPKQTLQLPRELRSLMWKQCPAPAIKFCPYSELVYLNLESSKIQQIVATGLEKLKSLNLSGCSLLKTLPDLSMCSKLEDLNLSYCDSLTTLDEAIGSLENLVHLNLKECRNLATVPSSLRTKRLQTLHLGRCFNVKKIPAIKEKNEFLEELHLTQTAVQQLPDSIGNLMALKQLHLDGCKELTVIPSSIYKMQALQVLKLVGCLKLSGFPRRDAGAATDVYGFPKLKSLIITGCKLKDLEFLDDLTCFETLTFLYLFGNEFSDVPASISKFKNLQELGLHGCKLKDLKFLDDLTCFETLTSLNLSGNVFTQVPESISKLKNLQVLMLDGCDQLTEVLELPNVPYINVAETDGQKCFQANLSNSCSLDHSNISRLLSIENVRDSVGAMSVIFPGEEFPHWAKFPSRECGSSYRVSLPQGMLKDGLVGLALFISFGHVDPSSSNESTSNCKVEVMVNRVHIIPDFCGEVVGIHSWYVYIPCQSLVERDGDLASESNRLDITMEISAYGVELRRWGMHLLCKREGEDDLIKVHEDEDDNDGSLGLQNLSVKRKRRLRLEFLEMNLAKRLKVR